MITSQLRDHSAERSPHCLSDRKRDYRVAVVLMMMGKVKNTAVYPRGHIKLQQLAEISGTWLAHWQRSSN